MTHTAPITTRQLRTTCWEVEGEPRQIFITMRLDKEVNRNQWYVIDEDIYDTDVVSKEPSLDDAIEAAERYISGGEP